MTRRTRARDGRALVSTTPSTPPCGDDAHQGHATGGGLNLPCVFSRFHAATRKQFAILLLLPLLLGTALPVNAQDLVIYTRQGCPYCQDAKAYLEQAKSRHPEFRYELRDIDVDEANYRAFAAAVERFRLERAAVPLMVIGDEVVVGFREPETPERIAELMGWDPHTTADARAGPQPAVPTWLSLDRLGLPTFTVLMGLVDGFNPCAMWVLMFLLSMLLHIRSRKRMFLVAGIFVLVSGLVYFLFMAAWLNLFLAFRFSTALRIAIGGLGLTAAAFHLKDFLFGLEGPSLSIREDHKGRIGERMRAVVTARNLPLALLAVTGLAVLVNFYELLCTAGLPALYTQILVQQDIEGWRFYAYLALYNLAYIFDDGLMVFSATWALSSRRIGPATGRWLKGLSGLVLLLLSVLVIWKPEWLSFNP